MLGMSITPSPTAASRAANVVRRVANSSAGNGIAVQSKYRCSCALTSATSVTARTHAGTEIRIFMITEGAGRSAQRKDV